MAKRKKRRMRRAYMKRWSSSVVKVKERVTPGWAGQDGLNYAKRARNVDYVRERLFAMPNTVNLPRVETLKKIEEFTLKADPLHNICLESSPRKKLFLFFSPTQECFFVKREGMMLHRSIYYSTRKIAMQTWHGSRTNNKIIWVESHELTT